MVQWAYSDDMNASGSGAPAQAATGHDCSHVPQSGTIYTATGLAVTPLTAMPADYPLEAMCGECGQPIRIKRYFFADWELK